MKSLLLDIPEQSLVLQRLVSIVGPEQGLPPWLDLVFTVRLLLCIPPPQEALHSVHRPYSPHSQLTNFNFQYKLNTCQKKYIQVKKKNTGRILKTYLDILVGNKIWFQWDLRDTLVHHFWLFVKSYVFFAGYQYHSLRSSDSILHIRTRDNWLGLQDDNKNIEKQN